MATEKKKANVQWFIGCGNNQIPNESLAAALAEIGIGEAEGVKHPDMLCSDGKRRDVWEIPGHFVAKLRAAKQSDARYTFRFFKRNGTSGPISPAGFIEQRRQSVFLLEARKNLRKRRARAMAAAAGEK